MTRFWRRLTRPFRVRVITFEHTRVRVRSFPPLFEHAWQESLTERIERGGVVDLEEGVHVVYDQLTIPTSVPVHGVGRLKSIIHFDVEHDPPSALLRFPG